MRTRLLSLAALMMVSTAARAQEPPAPPPAAEAPPPTAPSPVAAAAASGLGAAGQIALAADLPLMNSAPQFAILHQSSSMGGTSATIVFIAPSLDYFVAPGVSVGGIVGYGSASVSNGGGDTTTFVVGGRVGYNVSLSEAFSLWARLGILYVHDSASIGGTSQSGYNIPLVFEVPILWHPAPHFFLGAGPTILTQLVNKVESTDVSKRTQIGVTAMIGGYFGGT